MEGVLETEVVVVGVPVGVCVEDGVPLPVGEVVEEGVNEPLEERDTVLVALGDAPTLKLAVGDTEMVVLPVTEALMVEVGEVVGLEVGVRVANDVGVCVGVRLEEKELEGVFEGDVPLVNEAVGEEVIVVVEVGEKEEEGEGVMEEVGVPLGVFVEEEEVEGKEERVAPGDTVGTALLESVGVLERVIKMGVTVVDIVRVKD